MKIVLDSNVLLITIGKRSRFKPIWDAFLEGRYQIIISEDIVHEYEEILYTHSAPGATELVMEIFSESPDIIYQRAYFTWNAITADPDDNKFFDAAVAGNADYLVTNDAHFKEVKELDFPKVNIHNADDFLSVLKDL